MAIQLKAIEHAVLSCCTVCYAVQGGSNVKFRLVIMSGGKPISLQNNALLALNTDKAYIVCSTLYTKAG